MKENWLDIEGYESYYQVSNFGRVRSLDRYINAKNGSKAFCAGRVLKQDSSGRYLRVCLMKSGKKKNFMVHRLVAKAFVENPNNKTQINHKDGNRFNNKYDNLEWCTPSENVYHAYKTKLTSAYKGSAHPLSKLTENDVIEIRYLREKGLVYKEIAQRYNVALTTIYAVCSGQNWGHMR